MLYKQQAVSFVIGDEPEMFTKRWRLIISILLGIVTCLVTVSCGNQAPLRQVRESTAVVAIQQDPSSFEGKAETQLIAWVPQFQKNWNVEITSDRISPYTSYFVKWQGKGLIPVLLKNSAPQTGLYKEIFFSLDTSTNKVIYQGTVDVELTQLDIKAQTLPIKWKGIPGTFLKGNLGLTLLKNGETVGTGDVDFDQDNLPSSIDIRNLRVANTDGLRAEIEFVP